MKILFVTNEIPFPPDNGVRIVSHHAMRLMREAGHEMALAVLTEETDNNEERFQKAAAFCASGMAWWMPLPRRSKLGILVKALVAGKPFYIERYRSSLFRRRLRQLIYEFKPDVIHFDLITMSQYRDLAPAGVGMVASINDSFSLALENYLAWGNYKGVERLYRQILHCQTRRYEAETYARFGVTHVMAEADAAYLRLLNPAIATVVIPNGVDQSLFAVAEQTSGKTDLIFVGKLADDYLLYLEQFLKNAWPIIHGEHPYVKLHVVGKVGPQAELLRARASRLEGVVLEGYAECLSDAYKGCGIAIVPVNKDCGIINKAIEAMAAGMVVVGFEKTFKAIGQARYGEHFLSATDYAGMGRSVAEIIRDEPRRIAIQRNAHELAVKHYAWSSRKEAYENMYRISAEERKT